MQSKNLSLLASTHHSWPPSSLLQVRRRVSVVYRNHEHAKLRRLAVESHEILRELTQLQVQWHVALHASLAGLESK